MITIGEDTFVSLEYANAYFARRPYSSAWTTATEEARENALIAAARHLDVLDWEGFRTSKAQPLSWPRRYVLDHEGELVPADFIPPRLAQAQCELAILSLAKDLTTIEPGIRRKRVGDLEVEYESAMPDVLPAHVRRLVSSLMRDQSPHSARLIF
jgi:hypothetical protein